MTDPTTPTNAEKSWRPTWRMFALCLIIAIACLAWATIQSRMHARSEIVEESYRSTWQERAHYALWKCGLVQDVPVIHLIDLIETTVHVESGWEETGEAEVNE